jgi:two-component sensor histidine kinase
LVELYCNCKRWFLSGFAEEHPDSYQLARAELLFNASLLTIMVFLPLVIYMLVNGLHAKTIPSVIGLFFVVVQMAIFRITKSTWWSSLFICSITTVIVCANINFNDSEVHLIEPFWMIGIVVFAVFMLGVKWGVFFCVLLMTGFAFFVVNKLESNLRAVLDSIPSAKYFLVCEISAALFTLVYILSMFIRTTTRSEQALREVNTNLGSQNQLVRRQNAEITVLLKEIHHRVKNNLQVINSLLRLQSDQLDDSSRKVFDDAQYRIRAIGLIHERMYKSAELSDIEPNAYFRELMQDLLHQHVTHQSVRLTATVELGSWDPNTVIPLGLLLNELIANSVEHGQLGENGAIAIALQADGKRILLQYADNGRGFPDDFRKGFGLELIETLCEQLNGTMALRKDGKGVAYDFTFSPV